jgi:peptide deformylase
MRSFILRGLMSFLPLMGFSSENLHFVDCMDPILETKSRALTQEEIQDSRTQQFFDHMLLLARGEQGNARKSILVGLAAPQIGHAIRVILVDVQANGKGLVAELRLYINPEIVAYSEETEEWYEGCYSTGNIKGIVRRPAQVTIKALNRTGEEIFETHSGYVARIFQHEIDHLNGIRFPQRVPEEGHLHIVKEHEMYDYRNSQAWREWQNTIPQSDWKAHMR